MNTEAKKETIVLQSWRFAKSFLSRSNHAGQALVEFTLVFILLLVVAWIPADFGLGFYTAQLAGNAAREGARIAAADRNLAPATCGPPLSACFGAGNILNETAVRVPSALLTDTVINVTLDDAAVGCNRMVTVNVTGNYNYFFYRMLRWFNVSIPTNSTQIVRATKMRWEHQTACPSF